MQKYAKTHVKDSDACVYEQATHANAHSHPRPPPSQRPSQSSVLTPMELISHGSAVHLLPQTLGCSHIMLTQNTITSACLHCSCGAIKKKKRKREKKTRTGGRPVGCDASSPRFNVNLILSLALRRSRLNNRRGESSSVIKGFCSPKSTHTTHNHLYTHTHTHRHPSTYIQRD